MSKFVLIIVLGVIAVVLVAAVCGKNPLDMVVRTSYKIKDFIDRVVNKKTYKEIHHGLTDGTIQRPVLEIIQLKSMKKSIFNKIKGNIYDNFDKYIFAKHVVYNRMFIDENDKSVAVTISRPDADSDGIKLYADITKDGQYDTRNQTTHDALSVSTDAIALVRDEKGFYGQVTNPHAEVYLRNKNNKSTKIPFGGQFNVTDDTFICIGYQWLCFKSCEQPEFEDDFGLAEETVDAPPLKVDLGNIKRRIDAAVNDVRNNDAEPKTKPVSGKGNPKSKPANKPARSGNPLEEDDF